MVAMATMYPQEVLEEFGITGDALGGMPIEDETECWWWVQDKGAPNREFAFADTQREAITGYGYGGEVREVLRSSATRVLVSYDNQQDTADAWVLLRADRELFPEGA